MGASRVRESLCYALPATQNKSRNHEPLHVLPFPVAVVEKGKIGRENILVLTIEGAKLWW